MRRIRPVLAVTLAVTFIAAIVSVQPAYAATYPSWKDVQAAKANTAAAVKAVDNIKTLISGLEDQVAAARGESSRKQAEYDTAKAKLDAATATAEDIEAQALQSQSEATAAAKSAGQIVAQMFKSAGTDMTLSIFLESDPSKVDELLSKLGNMNRVAGRANDVYTHAAMAAKTAKSLGAQAKKAQAERGKLEAAANTALADARAAQGKVEAALAEQESKQFELEQQLAFLQSQEQATAAAYQAGVEERKRYLALLGGGALPGGWISDQGWANPARGRLGDGYGPRDVICTSSGCSGSFHYGQDIVASCDTPIYSASQGRVVAAGYYGTWGNRVKIDHGGGIYTLYAHIRDGGIEVNVGDFVDVGQEIARVGTTGASTGCHLHFEVYTGSTRIDPLPFMRDRGVTLG